MAQVEIGVTIWSDVRGQLELYFLKKNIVCSAPTEGGGPHPRAEKDGTRGALGGIRNMKVL